MTRIPSTVAVASLDTHRLIIAVPNEGAAEVASNLPRPVAATVLRQLADQLDDSAGRCENCGHSAHGHAEHLTTPAALADCPQCPCAAELRELSADTPEPGPTPAPEGELTAAIVRDALDFNAGERDQVLATLRDVLLDTSLSRTPAQALATARILLDAHARQLAALVEAHRANIKARWGLSRSTRSLLTGYEGARKIVTAYAAGLADEQALADDAATKPADR
ncbi:hypothetical protein ACFWHG_09555 [Streptomyces microflavus]|uniref:hypothetical protein n=1 Tax=Streptomyces microflavus TaxID=1919 RepID=UPI00365EE0CC